MTTTTTTSTARNGTNQTQTTTHVTTSHSSNQLSSPVETKRTRITTNTTYVAKAQFEIGEEPENSSGCNAKHLEEEIRAVHQSSIAELTEEQIIRFESEDSRVNSLGLLERAHEELTGENNQEIEETRRLTEISKQIDTEISERKSRISSEIDELKQKNIELEGVYKQVEQQNDVVTKEHNQLQEVVNKSEDLNEQGFSTEAKEIRLENSELKKQIQKYTSTLMSESAERDNFLSTHSQTVKAYNDTINEFNGLLSKAEQTRKINLDHLNEIKHEFNTVEDKGEHLDQKYQISEINIESMSQSVEALRADLSTNNRVYSLHISELSEIITQQKREIGGLKDEFNGLGAKNRNMQMQIDKQRLDYESHEKEMDMINAIGYSDKVSGLQDDLKRNEEQRRSQQDDLENAQEGLSTKLEIFKGQEKERKKHRDENLDKVAD